MKTKGLEQIMGKTITGVVVKRARIGRRTPSMQLHLVFNDGTCFEMYTMSGEIFFAGGVDGGGFQEALDYGSDVLEVVFQAHLGEGGGHES